MSNNRVNKLYRQSNYAIEDLEEEWDDYGDLARFGDKNSPRSEYEKDEPKYCTKTWDELKAEYNIPSYEKLTEGWFSLQPLLSYNRHLLIGVGMRNSGKSTGTPLWLIPWFLKYNEGWMYCRRDKIEVEQTADSWFDNAVNIINGYITKEEDKLQCEYKGGRYLLNGRLAGIAVSLKLQQKLKSKNLSWVKWQIYDEAITQSGTGYIGGLNNPIREYDYLMSLRQTADRDIGIPYKNSVVTICLANNEGFYNPLYMGTGADRYIRADSHFVAPKGEEWVVQQMRQDDAPRCKDFEESVAFKLASENMRQKDFYNLNDQQALDNAFVKKMETPGAVTLCNLHSNGYDMVLKSDYRHGIAYICHGQDKRCSRDYALTLTDQRPNYMLLTNIRSTEAPITLMRTFRLQGQLFFENTKCRRLIDTFLRYIV